MYAYMKKYRLQMAERLLKANKLTIGEIALQIGYLNKEAVEYIRGIPVVKVFQQTVYSFKNFHAAIEEYEKYASGYALKCRIPMTGFNVALNSTFILLIPVTVFGTIGLHEISNVRFAAHINNDVKLVHKITFFR